MATTDSPAAPPRAHPLADPLALFLLMVALLLTWAQIRQRAMPTGEAAQAGSEARIAELRWAFGKQFGIVREAPAKATKAYKNKWGAAVDAVLLSEDGRADEARSLLLRAPQGAFRACWEAAYNSGPPPPESEIALAREGLSGGLASKLLEASLEARYAGKGANKAQPDALLQYGNRAAALFVLACALIASGCVGIVIGIKMLLRPEPIPPAPQFGMPAMYAVRACLGWYVAFLSSATAVGSINSIVPLGLWALPMAYALHAAPGIAFVCAAEKISPAGLWEKISQRGLPWAAKGFKFLLLALGSVLLAALLLSFFMPDGEPPQKELADLIRTARGAVPFLLIFGTVAVLGPAFEEVFFRGFLLSAMRRRLNAPWSLLFSSLLFGAIHFQLQNIPLLAILGGALGLAFMATGDIRVAIFVHGCWNGGVFLFQRLLLS